MSSERKRMMPTKEQWEEITKKLSGVYGTVYLLIDGYQVAIARRMIKKNQLCNVVFVNGEIKSEWGVTYRSNEKKPEIPEEVKRFWRPRCHNVFTPKSVQPFVKKYGKRRAEKEGCFDKKYHFDPYWSGVVSLKRHLMSNNESIEYFPDGFPEEQKDAGA